MADQYTMTWITESLAVGHAPMSYDDLDSIREQGITAIVNLCEEFCDLHELEEGAGFEVFYLPIADETAPSMADMEQGLAWLDEAMYLGKKVLIHCKHGVGRTGTFVTAYMLRRGFSLRKAEKVLRKAKTRANPSNFSQWWLLRKFGRKEGQLKRYTPSAENRQSDDLSVYYRRYEQLLARVDQLVADKDAACCGKAAASCDTTFNLSLIEALYLNNKVNVALTSKQRNGIIDQAVGLTATDNEEQAGREAAVPAGPETSCPLRQQGTCLLHAFRPLHCRLAGCFLDQAEVYALYEELALLSEEVFYALFGQEAADCINLPEVSNRDTLSGKFIQKYFHSLSAQKSQHKGQDEGKSE